MDDMTPAVNSSDGTRIAYDKMGQGPVLILVLGALSSRQSGAELARLLSSRFTVISYDRRGRGDSTNTLPYSPEREIEDLEALIDASGESAYLYGHSSGAALSLEAAIKLGNKVGKLALYEAPYDSSDDNRRAWDEYNKRLAELLNAGCNDDAVALFMQFIGIPFEQIQGMRHAPVWEKFEAIAPTLPYDSAVMGDDLSVPADRASGIEVPTLVMAGGDSPAAMRDTAQLLSRAIPNARFRLLEGQIHNVKPDVIAPVLAEFFSGADA